MDDSTALVGERFHLARREPDNPTASKLDAPLPRLSGVESAQTVFSRRGSRRVAGATLSGGGGACYGRMHHLDFTHQTAPSLQWLRP